MRQIEICGLLTLSLFLLITTVTVNAQLVDDNSTNFHNIIYNRAFNLSRYHTYPFDVWKKIDFVEIYKKFESSGNETDDNDDGGILAKVTSMCGKLLDPNVEASKKLAKFLSRHCLEDLDFIFCSTLDFFGALKQLIKGDCHKLADQKAIEQCQINVTTVITNNFWAIQMLDSYGKLNPGINLGNHQHLGRYHDCRNIYVPRGQNRPYQAAYCRATFQVPVPESAAIVSDQCLGIPLENGIGEPLFYNRSCEPKRNFARMKFGICAPSTCNTRNMTILFRIILPPTKHFCNTTVVCELRYFDFGADLKFILVVSIICLFGLIMICGTIYDLFFYQEAKSKLYNDHTYVVVHNIDARETLDDPKAHTTTTVVDVTRQRHKNVIESEHYDNLPWYCKFLLAFSVYTNGAAVLSIVDKPNEFRCVNAVRALSIAWLISILAHVYVIGYIDNTKILWKFISRFCFQMINNGSYVSDTFLLLSGFCMAYWFIKRKYIRNIGSPKFWLKFYFRRWLRLAPPFFILIIILLFVWKYCVRGPMWTVYFFNVNSPLRCLGSFWTNFLFLNNFIRIDSPCLPVTQLLAVDFQIYLFAPLLFLLYMKRPKIGFTVCSLLILISVVFQALSVIFNELPPSLIATVDLASLDQPMTKYWNKIFIKPYMRWNAFIIGMMLGHLVARNSCRGKSIRIGKNLTVLLWFIAITLCSCVVYGLTGYARGLPMSIYVGAIYTALSRLVWSLAVGAILFLCSSNRGGIIEWIFNWPFWGPISRLSYSAFLISPFVIVYTYASSQVGLHLSTFNMVYFSWGIILMTHLVAFVFHLTFEAPFLAFRRLFKSMIETPDDRLDTDNNDGGAYTYTPPPVHNDKHVAPKFEESHLLPAAVIVHGVELKNVTKL